MRRSRVSFLGNKYKKKKKTNIRYKLSVFEAQKMSHYG